MTRALAEVDAEMTALTRRLATGTAAVDPAMAAFIERVIGKAVSGGSRPTIEVMAGLPLAVAGAGCGVPARGGLAGVIHLLWWTAARYLDDLADAKTQRETGPAGGDADRLADDAGILTAMATGTHLPARLIEVAPVADPTRTRLTAEVTRCWLDGISGQLLDYVARPADTSVEAVLRSYAGKTGAPYAMAAALAAILAGAGADRTDRWRRFGLELGVLRQLGNDRRDLTTGRDEDLRNGTVTYLLAYLLDPLPDERRAELLTLHAAARDSDAARARFRRHLLDPAVLDGYAKEVDAMAGRIHQDLDELGGDEPYLSHLHAMVDQSATIYPLTGAAPQD